MLAIDIKENRDTVKKYVDKKAMPFPVLLDTKGDIARNFGVRGTPAHLLIDKKGEIKAFATGFKNMNTRPTRKLIQLIIDDKV